MKRIASFMLSALCLTAMLALVSCGKGGSKPETGSSAAAESDPGSPAAAAEASSASAVENPAEETFSENGETVALLDVTDPDAVMGFAAGRWIMTDILSGKDIGELTVGDGGSLSFKRNGTEAGLEGSVAFEHNTHFDVTSGNTVEDPEVTSFTMKFPLIPKEFTAPDRYLNPGSETVSGLFQVGRGRDEDALYLTWLGNGDSFVFDRIFQDAERLEAGYRENGECEPQSLWFLHRPSEDLGSSQTAATEAPAAGVKNAAGVSGTKTPDSSGFYAFCWKDLTGKTLLLERMEPHDFESLDEYSNRRYSAGYFAPDGDVGINEYSITDATDTSLVLNMTRLKGDHPLMMLYVKADGERRLTSIEEVPASYYGLYDMGDLPAKLDHRGTVLIYNGGEYDLMDYGLLTNAITDVKQVGEWIVVDGHVNPHRSLYYLLNTGTGSIEKVIDGVNLTWKGDDITTAVYSLFNEVYNYKGHLVGIIDGDEVEELSFTDGGSTVTAKDLEGKTYVFDAPAPDTAMYRYASFIRNRTPANWKAFLDEAPEGAVGFVMENPDEDIAGYLPAPSNEDTGSGETVYVVALTDGSEVKLETGSMDPDPSGNGFTWRYEGTEDESVLKKGEARGYYTVIPEGIPSRSVFISDGEKSGRFQVQPISGMNDACSEFVTTVR